jgi:hypothetical protein
MTLSQHQRIFTQHIGMLIAFAYQNGIGLTFGEAHRTPSQMLLNFFGYEVVRSGNGIALKKVPRLSKTLLSLHADRLAVDFNFFINGKLTYAFEDVKILGDYWESLDPLNRWGGDFNNNDVADGFVDTPHFERKRR